MGGDGKEGGGGVSATDTPVLTSGCEAVLSRPETVPTCPSCGVPIPEDDSLCDECRLAALERMLALRAHLARTVSDEACDLPYKYRRLS